MAAKPRTKAIVSADIESEPLESRLPARAKALVFISHDSRDADLAEAFSNLLTDVSAGMLKSFRASDKKGTTGIAFGAEWYKSIMSQLEDSTDVVALLTPRSIERPWILYEAGVAKGKLGTTVLGVALGASLETVSAGPFGQFQNCGDDEDSLTKLVVQLLQRNPDADPREAAVRMQVKIFRAKVEEILAKAGEENAPTSEEEDDSNVAKLFEEIKAMVRDLPAQTSDRLAVSPRGRGMGDRRFHPAIIEEVVFSRRFMGNEGDEAARLLLVLSFVRDDVPWIYEAGMDLYRALRSGSVKDIEYSYKHMRHILEFSDHPIFFEINRNSDGNVMPMLHIVREVVDRIVPRARNFRAHSSSAGIERAASKKDGASE